MFNFSPERATPKKEKIMKKYSFDIHYDMVIRDVEVMADTMEEARQLAYDQAARLPMESMECVEKDACLSDTEELTAREIRKMENAKFTEYLKGWFASYDDPTDIDQKRTLYAIAFAKDTPYWLADISKDTPQWERNFMQAIEDGTHPRQAVFERYTRMYGRQVVTERYGRVAKSLFAADCEGTDKLRKKQAVVDGLQVLCDKMEEYVCHQDDEDFKGWEPQMVIRYESETGDAENYWNLFVYCTGPNDQDGDDYLSLATAWQHVWTDSNGRDATDDYGTEEHPTRAALLRYLFYGEPQEFDETDEKVVWQRMTDVWVD